MARKKEAPKPMFSLRHDFVASLENVCQQALMLMQATEMVLRHEATPPAIKTLLQERVDSMRAALMSDEE